MIFLLHLTQHDQGLTIPGTAVREGSVSHEHN